jgi:hypothetical protein
MQQPEYRDRSHAGHDADEVADDGVVGLDSGAVGFSKNSSALGPRLGNSIGCLKR